MKSHLIALILFPFLGINSIYAQNFKVIEETKDYILKECDSVYYYSHGLPPKYDFIGDTCCYHLKKGKLILPIENGKSVAFKEKSRPKEDLGYLHYIYEGYNPILKKYLVWGYDIRDEYWYLINKENGWIDTSRTIPQFSPTLNYYVYTFGRMKFCPDFHDDVANDMVKFINIKTLKEYSFKLEGNFLAEIKWSDESSFMIHAALWDCITYNFTSKYYLVQIKQ